MIMAGECPTCGGTKRLIGFGGLFAPCHSCVVSETNKSNQSAISSPADFSKEFEKLKKRGRPAKAGNHG